MSEPKGPDIREETCLRACLDAMDYCVDSAGPSTFAVGCCQGYGECADHCDGRV